MLKLYGHYVSQPLRSVAWLLKLNSVPFEFIKVEPIHGDTKKPEYTSKFPTALSPAIDDNGFYLAECSAICQYLCEKYKWNSFYPLGNDIESIKQRAKINEYTSHHHHSSRLLTIKHFRVVLESVMTKKPIPQDVLKQHEEAIFKIANKFQTTFLNNNTNNNKYINNFVTPTIADFIAYPEYAQMSQLGIVNYKNDPNLIKFNEWLNCMNKINMHDDIHKTLFKLASLIPPK